MGEPFDLLQAIDQWAEERLITSEQATVLRARVRAEQETRGQRRVQPAEIFVYLGSLVVSLALAFLAILNWQALGSTGRLLVVLLPTLIMLGLGAPLRSAESARLRRGAQALWLGGCLLAGVSFLVLFNELQLIDWRQRGPTDFYFFLSCLLAGGVSALFYAVLPTVVQSLPLHLWLTVAFLSFLGWLDTTFPPFNPWRTLLLGLLVGTAWLALAAWLVWRGRAQLAAVSELVGAVTFLATPFLLASSDFNAGWQRVLMEVITFVATVSFIVASVRLQSRILLYSGATVLLFFITYLNFERFADQIGLPVALFIAGASLIALGLGANRLGRTMARGAPRQP